RAGAKRSAPGRPRSAPTSNRMRGRSHAHQRRGRLAIRNVGNPDIRGTAWRRGQRVTVQADQLIEESPTFGETHLAHAERSPDKHVADFCKAARLRSDEELQADLESADRCL